MVRKGDGNQGKLIVRNESVQVGSCRLRCVFLRRLLLIDLLHHFCNLFLILFLLRLLFILVNLLAHILENCSSFLQITGSRNRISFVGIQGSKVNIGCSSFGGPCFFLQPRVKILQLLLAFFFFDSAQHVPLISKTLHAILHICVNFWKV